MSNKYYHYKFHLMLTANGYFDNLNVFYSIFTFNVLFYTLFNYRNAAASITERKIHESVSNIPFSSKISKNKISEAKYQCVDYFNVLLNNFKILYHSISWEKTNWRHKKQNTRKILTSSWIITVICRDFFLYTMDLIKDCKRGKFNLEISMPFDSTWILDISKLIHFSG